MSLYVGNLSARTRRDDLERVFRRYGQCSVRIKDGYGFVVYEYPPNAEIALRELHKSYNLSWSNKQPRQFRRFVRGDRQNEGLRGRGFARERDYVNQKLDSKDREFKMSVKQVNDGGGFRSADVPSEERAGYGSSFNGYVRRDDHDGKEFQDQGDGIETELVGNDRWGEQYHDPPNENGVESQVQFDRYEPNQDERKNDDDDYQRTAYVGGSPAHRSSREISGRDHLSEAMVKRPSDVKFSEGCYSCGGIGHKMRNCPHRNASRRRYSRFDQRHEDDIDTRDRGKGEPQKYQPSSWEKMRSSGEDSTQKRLKNDIKSIGPEKHGSFARNGNSTIMKETNRYLEKEHGGNKRNRKEVVSPERRKIKKSRMVASSPLHSDYTASGSRSTSQSSKHVPRSPSNAKSRSLSSRAHSTSSDLRSPTTRLHSRLKNHKSRSRSSSPTSLSLSVSIGRPLPSSSNKVQLNQKGSSDNVTTPESNVKPKEGDVFEDAIGGQIKEVNEDAPSSSNERNEREDIFLPKDNAFNLTDSKSLDGVTNQSIAVAEKDKHTVDNICHEGTRETNYFQHTDALMMEQAPNAVEKSDSEVPLSADHSTRFSPEELQMVLKHYGLDLPSEDERQFPVDAYFGSARLWPWEVIYYRRLKKGPISVENYAKRVEQNREFGIVDKYIRSSSGWGELDRKNG